MKSRILLTLGILAATTAFAGEAAAQNNGEYPVRLVMRPQTIPARTLRADGEFAFVRLNVCVGRTCVSGSTTNLNLGGGFGITHDFEVGAIVAPLQLTETFAYGNPSLYGRYQFLHNNNLQVSGEVRATIPVREGSSFGLQVGAPVWYNFSDQFQLRTGLFYSTLFSDPLVHGLNVPLHFNLNLNDNLHFALLTGLNLPLQNPGKTMSIPLGIEAGYALMGNNNRPLLDVVAYFSFPSFLVPGSDGDVLGTSLFTAGLAGRFYLFM